MRDSLKLLLSLSGFDAASFETGFELQNVVAARKIDCLIIDVNMPGMSGLELISWLNDRGHDIPIILISAKFDSVTKRRARQSGATCFLEKPFSDERLIDAIRGLLN